VNNPVEIMHIVLPYDLTEDRILKDLELTSLPVSQSLEWLYNEASEEELPRILKSVVVMLEKGVDLDKALTTAIVWERG